MRAVTAAFLALAAACVAAPAIAHTQCAPYAREISGIDLYGAAGGWWDQAAGHYARGHAPEPGAVLAAHGGRRSAPGTGADNDHIYFG